MEDCIISDKLHYQQLSRHYYQPVAVLDVQHVLPPVQTLKGGCGLEGRRLVSVANDINMLDILFLVAWPARIQITRPIITKTTATATAPSPISSALMLSPFAILIVEAASTDIRNEFNNG